MEITNCKDNTMHKEEYASPQTAICNLHVRENDSSMIIALQRQNKILIMSGKFSATT
jgi:hypothetical protein